MVTGRVGIRMKLLDEPVNVVKDGILTIAVMFGVTVGCRVEVVGAMLGIADIPQ